jgi:GGDEF domain-containing protein
LFLLSKFLRVSRSRGYGHPPTVVALDLTILKPISDHFGHRVGGQVLRNCCAPEQSHPPIGPGCPYGGDRFLSWRPECTAELVRTILACWGPFEPECKGERIPVSCSLGWVGYERGETAQPFLERADHTL